MSAADPTSTISAAVDPHLSLCSIPSPTTISVLELPILSSNQTDLVLLSGEVGDSEGKGDERKEQAGEILDLVPVHNILLQLASTLQVKVDLASRELLDISSRLAGEMKKTADTLSSLGEVKLPSGFSLLLTNSPASETILAIHHYRDQAVSALITQAELLSTLHRNTRPAHLVEDFDMASYELDSSIEQLSEWRDQLVEIVSKLQNSDGETNVLRRFSSERCRDIDMLERDAVLKKMGELSIRNCSWQSRKPVRSVDHTLDLQKIMLLAETAKSLAFKVSIPLLQTVNMLNWKAIAATITITGLIKEHEELIRRYYLYLKLKIQQQDQDSTDYTLQKLSGEGCLVEEEEYFVDQREEIENSELPRFLGRKRPMQPTTNCGEGSSLVGGENVVTDIGGEGYRKGVIEERGEGSPPKKTKVKENPSN